MSTKSDKNRIIALQKSLKIARTAMQSAIQSGMASTLEEALEEIDRLDVNSKPTGLQGICGHGKNIC
ncbi:MULTISPECIES: hypothetical protein [unclassified Rhizobium]|uniref:hypothetical protein n=1 Tax=unclassified Rhizobium TaxID=2613769 RepID=UPI00288B37F1|nr:MULTISPECIES: hypothetical protein [unclassified Rhizobium]